MKILKCILSLYQYLKLKIKEIISNIKKKFLLGRSNILTVVMCQIKAITFLTSLLGLIVGNKAQYYNVTL